MRRLAFIGMVSLVVSACGTAKAVTPDATNPAHCIAAFGWGAYWFGMTTPKHTPNRAKIAEMLAHARYERNKIRASGASVSAAEAEGENLTKAYAEDGDKLGKLMLDCSLAHTNDAEFRQQWPSLLASARADAERYPTR